MNTDRIFNTKRKRRIAVAVLIVLLVVVMGVYLVSSMIVIDENGAHVVDKYGVLEEIQQEQEAVTEPAEEEASALSASSEPDMRAVILSTSALCDDGIRGELIELAQAGKVNTVIVDIKDEDGELAIAVDTTELDSDELTDASADAMARAIGQLREADIHVVGRLHCLHDDTTARRASALAISYYRGGTWTDYDNTRWLDPTSSNAVNYLCDVAKAAVSAGCDELALAELTFPPRGHLDRAEFAYEPSDQASVLKNVLQSIQAAGDVPVSLSADDADELLTLSESGVEDGIETGDIGAYLRTAHCIYLWADSAEDAQQLTDEIHALAEDTLVVPIFVDGTAWLDYDGAAVLYGRRDYASALQTIGDAQQ